MYVQMHMLGVYARIFPPSYNRLQRDNRQKKKKVIAKAQRLYVVIYKQQ